MRFSYNWSFSGTNFTKDKGKVFSCFACGGGSTMGYKLAGFDVIGCLEIDKKIIEVYKLNHKPKYAFCESITTFKNKIDLPAELYNLDILDGSPPCSSFSMSGQRERNWGKEKKFKEWQTKQILDTLFFNFIDLAKRLQPKIVIAENVKGILLGNAKKYVIEIYKQFDSAGYYLQHFILDASKMGVPQKRERVFFIGLRKDLAKPFLEETNMFETKPNLELNFNDQQILFSEISDDTDTYEFKNKDLECVKLYELTKPGESFSKYHAKGSLFNYYKLNKNEPLPTITANAQSSYNLWHPEVCRLINDKEVILGSSFPLDYNFNKMNVGYICGMSVPPVMMANISNEIHKQWLSNLN